MEAPFRPASPPSEPLPAYYQDLGDDDILSSFRNFDNEGSFDLFDRQTRNPRSSNFCVDFGDDDAFCAFDLCADSFSRLISAPRPAKLHTRWINLWMPYNQKDTLHALARHYDFSPRLLGLMRTDPLPPRPNELQTKKSSATLGSRKSQKSHRSKSQNSKNESLDSEESIGMTEMMHSTQLEMVRDLSHYHIVDEVWHWSTVDWGRRCKFCSCLTATSSWSCAHSRNGFAFTSVRKRTYSGSAQERLPSSRRSAFHFSLRKGVGYWRPQN